MTDSKKSKKIVSYILNRPKSLLILGLIIIFTSYPYAVGLYANLHAGIEELLPKSATSIKALDTLRERIGDNLQLTLLVSGEKSADLKRFANELALEAEKIPLPNKPRFIDFKPSIIQDFFKYRKLLFISTDELEKAKNSIKEKVKKANPLSLGLDDDEDEKKLPTIDIETLMAKYENEANKLPKFKSGYYQNDQADALVLIFYPMKGVSGYGASLKFKKNLDLLAHQTAQKLNLNNLKIEFSGDVESIIQEQKSLEKDLFYSTTIVVVLESILMFFFFRWIPSILTLGLPLIAGVLLTFAISFFAVGSVNLTTAFLGSIIIGNGVNAGIILLARFIEEKRKGLEGPKAMETAVLETWRFTLAASGAAALAYASLMVTAFRGYSQFGFIGGIGMMICWGTTYLFSPPLGILFDRYFPIKSSIDKSDFVDNIFRAFASFAIHRWKAIVAFTVIVSIGAGVIFNQYIKDPFEYDTTKLRSDGAKVKGGYLEIDARAESILKHNILPMVVLLKSSDDVQNTFDNYKKLVTPDSILGDVFTLQSLIPTHQEEKISIIQSIKAEVPEKKRKYLKGKMKKYFDEVIEASNLTPYKMENLPEAIRRQFRELDGSEGKLVLLFPKFGTDTKDGRVVLNFAKEVRSVELPKGAVIAGSHLVFADMLAAISHDGPKATIISFIAVVLLSIWLTRGGISGSFVLTIPLLIGVLWTLALASLFHMKINFLNFIALPITFGVGLDYAINVYGRFRHSDHSLEGLKVAIIKSGSAVTVCSATTIIGYMSLLYSQNGALYSFGMMAILGEIACLVAALIILPAMLSSKLR